ncbi:MAG: hypothetical protein ABI867_19470 [Kofleriaceae bacterium]
MIVPVLFVAAACGGGGSGDDVEIVDSPSANCTAPESFGAVTPAMQGAISMTTPPATTPDFFQMEVALDGATPPDVMLIQLYKGFGVFATDFPTTFPATIPLTGDEAQFASCGACILVLGDIGSDGMATGDPYLATGGTLTLTSISPMLTGTISNIELTRVTIDDQDTSAPSPDGCTSSVDSMSFTATPDPQ